MHLTSFIRGRADVELERLTREGTKWHDMAARRQPGRDYDQQAGCLLCNAFDVRSPEAYTRAREAHHEAEFAYMTLAARNGQHRTGAMIARLARRELGRRAIAAAYAALSDVEAETEKVS